MDYIKRFQNSQDMSVSVLNSDFDDHKMHIFLDNFHEGGKYTSQKIATRQS